MSIGMSYNDFWYADPFIVKAYRESHKLINEQKNQEMWLQGFYFYNALIVSLDNAFTKHSKAKYFAQPIKLTEEVTETEKQQEQDKAIASLMRLQGAMSRKFNGDTKCQL